MGILKRFLASTIATFFYCEYLIYKIVIYQCNWPILELGQTNDGVLNPHENIQALILSDPHLLGSQHGHWFDKLRREWQMKRSFQTALEFLHPDVVFILGDIFDEGMICDDEEWDEYVLRFHEIFHHPRNVKLYIVPGNHDIGFHYRMVSRSRLIQRFKNDFEVSGVNMLNLKGNVFILVNSMALEHDGCSFCQNAEHELNEVVSKLKCHHNYSEQIQCNDAIPLTTHPFILLHFPLYRSSEMNCTEQDSPPIEIRHEENREGWEVLSQSASQLLLKSLQPRGVFNGHTHHSCHVVHPGNIPEFTLPSFSWRNRNDPSFMMATFNPKTFAIAKCFLPQENTVILTYILLGVTWLLYIFWRKFQRKLRLSWVSRKRIF